MPIHAFESLDGDVRTQSAITHIYSDVLALDMTVGCLADDGARTADAGQRGAHDGPASAPTSEGRSLRDDERPRRLPLEASYKARAAHYRTNGLTNPASSTSVGGSIVTMDIE